MQDVEVIVCDANTSPDAKIFDWKMVGILSEQLYAKNTSIRNLNS